MAIDTNLLIAAPVLQDYLVDKDTGTPLAAGVVTFYEDSQRTTLKNWYYQATNSSPYSWLAGPNPMTLTGVGTFSDYQGNDVIPFFYPYNENNSSEAQPYYVTVYNSSGELEFTRSNFPFVPMTAQPGANVPTLKNYLINNEFWRNFQTGDLTTPSSTTIINGSTYYYQTLAPSAHAGFSMQDLIILKDITGATDTLTFQTFPSGTQVLTDDITPEYYLEWNCSAFQSGQTLKCIQFPLQLHIEALEQQQATITFHAKVNSGASNYQLAVQILQFTGTGQTNSTFVPIQTFTINNSWTKYTTTSFILPSAGSLPLSSAGDDALYVQFVFPATLTFDILFAKPQLYLSTTIPTNQWDTYDQVDSVINTPRTGDIRQSLNSFQPFGWVQMNDGIISNAGTFTLPANVVVARQNKDTWPLFNLLWNNVNVAYAPIFTSAGVSTTRGASAIDDWNAPKQMLLTGALSRALLGANPLVGSITNYNTSTGIFTVAEFFTSKLLVGTPVYLTGNVPSAFTVNTIYWTIYNATAGLFSLASSYSNALSSTPITGGTAGTPPFNIYVALGGTFGEIAHTQLEKEVGAHNHSINLFTAPGSSPQATVSQGSGVSAALTANTNNNSPASTPFNIAQLSAFYNVFMKL